MEFENNNTDIESLPLITDIDLNGLRPEYLRVTIISTILFYGVFISLLTIGYFIDPSEFPDYVFFVAITIILSLMVLSGVIKILGFRHKAYGVRDHDVLYKTGLIWRKETIVPFNRIQHVELGQGPIERFMNLAKIKIFTAGGNASDLVIPGLSLDNAQKIKTYLVSKIKVHEQ